MCVMCCLQIPLYPAVVVWRQLIGEEKSRINACKGVRICSDQALHARIQTSAVNGVGPLLPSRYAGSCWAGSCSAASH